VTSFAVLRSALKVRLPSEVVVENLAIQRGAEDGFYLQMRP
jgi:hypothetical protein